MKKQLLLAAGILFLLATTFAQSDYNVKRGERPPIDFENMAESSYEPGVLIIKFKPYYEEHLKANPVTKSGGAVSFQLESVDALNKQFGASDATQYFLSPAFGNRFSERHKAWGFHLWYKLEFAGKANIKQAVLAYNKLREIEIAEPNFKKELYSFPAKPDGKGEGDPVDWTPNDPYYGTQWHYHNTGQQSGTPDADIDLPEAWDIETGNSNVIVCIEDGGIQYNHPDIAANMWSGIGYNFVDGSSTIVPHDHGTHVAGTVAAVNNNSTGVSGVAGGTGSGDGVRLMSCQVFTNSSAGGFHLAPVWAADNGACISQNSWGYTSAGNYEQSVLDAIDYFNANGGGTAMTNGITIYAAGNSNSNSNYYPGYYSGTLAVAATNNQDVRSYYSNYGTWVNLAAPGGETISVTQRGVRSTVTGSSYDYYQGTSMACPHTSGVAALVASYGYGSFSGADVWSILENSTDNIDAQNPSYIGQLGTGRLNAYQALLEAEGMLSGLTPPPTFTATTAGTTQIDLAWTKNSNNHSVMVAWSSDGTFGTPVDGTVYSSGQTIPGGGTVLYRGAGTSYNHTSLNHSTTYYYKAFSYNGSDEYSSGKNASATTMSGLPFSEDLSACTWPGGWSQQNEGGASDRWAVENSNNAGGSACEFRASWESADPATSRLVTPGISTAGVSSINLSFKHFFDDFGSGVTATIQTSSDGATWTTESWSVNSGSGNVGPETVNLTISNNLGGTTYVAFVLTGNLYQFDNWYVDDITIDGTGGTPPSCTSPTAPVNGATDVPVSTDLSWSTATGATGYLIYFGTDNPPTNIENGTDLGNVTTYSPSGALNFNTDYYWKIVPYNTNGQATGCSVWDFTTENLNLINSFPYFESYESSEGEWIQPTNDDFDWTRNSGGTPSTNTGPTGAYDGSYYMYTESSSPNYPSKTAYFYANFDFTSLTQPILTFYYNMYGATMGQLYVEVSQDMGGSWTSIWSRSGEQGGATDWFNAIIDLSAYAGSSPVSIRFTGITGSNYTSDIAIDQVEVFNNVSGPPSCTTPVAPTDGSSDVSVDTDLSWNAVGDATGYYIYFGTNNPPTNIENGTDLGNVTTYSPSGSLNSLTDYYWQIVPYNTNGQATGCSVWSFTTEDLSPPTCTTPIAPTDGATDVSLNTDLTWNSQADATGYILYFGSDNPPTNIENGTDLGNVTSYTPASALSPLQDYYWQIVPYNAYGQATGCSVWSFTTQDQSGCNYCPSTYSNTTDDWITEVVFNGINNTSGQGGSNSYEDFTSISTDVALDETYTLSVSLYVGSTSWTQHCVAFIDWNQDCDFEDAGESFDAGEVSGSGTMTVDITVPSGALLGTTVMRIAERYNQNPGPCDVATYGEVEDYTLNIVPADYCDAGASNCDEYIARVEVGTIDNTSNCTSGGYHDYTSISTQMDIGTGYPITVTNGTTQWPDDQCGIWVDWNQDADFDDANEAITVNGTPGVGPYTGTITPPAGAVPGQTKMRIRIMWTGTLDPCGTTNYGEVEDYTIDVVSCTPPSVSVQPVDDVICETDNSSFSITAAGTGLTYQWQENDGSGFANIYDGGNYSNTQTPNLDINNVPLFFDGNEYRCVVTGTCGPDATSSSAMLTVEEAPEITDHPSNKSICEDGNTSFAIIATGTNIGYQWQYNDGSGWIDITDGGIYYGAQTETLIMANVPFSHDGYEFRCMVTGNCPPDEYSNPATLTIYEKPAISADPVDAQICEGNNTTFNVTASGYNILYQWQENAGSSWTDLSDGGIYSGTHTAALQLNGVTSIYDGYEYRCVVSGACAPDAISAVANLTVDTAPYIVTQPAATEVCEGETTDFSISAVGTALTYQWQAFLGGNWQDISDGGVYSGTNTTMLTLSNVTTAYDGILYRCVVSGACTPDANSFSAQLTVNELPVVTSDPFDETICEGGSLSFGISATGANLTYQWQENDGFGWYDITDGGIYSNTTTAVLSLTNVPLTYDLYEYRCVVTGECNPEAISNPATLFIDMAPMVTSDPDDVDICETGAAMFSINANGTNIAYQWQENDGSNWYDLSDGGIYSNTSSPTLNINNVPSSMSGYQYRCVVTGDCAPQAISASALLTVGQAPYISTQPTGDDICEGDNTSFSVTANGTNIAYQWQMDDGSGWSDVLEGGVFAGTQTSYLSLTGVPLTYDGYIFRCEITGDCPPAVHSNGVILTVSEIPAVLIDPFDVTVDEGTNASFSINASGDGLTYQWQEDSGSGWTDLMDGGIYSNTQTSVLNLTNIPASYDGYQYRCVVSGTCPPDVFSLPALLTVIPAYISVDITVNLEGAYSGTEMTTMLNPGVLPLNQPYNQAPWNYSGTESVGSMPNSDVVDWILIELRDAPGGPSTATGTTTVARQAGLLLRDGSIVDLDGASILTFNIDINDNLYVVVWHRNHLGVMTSGALTQAGGAYTWNFTTGATQAQGGTLGHKEIASGVYGMVSGDGNADGQIDNTDKNVAWLPYAGMNGYLSGDFNLDTQVDNTDKNVNWFPNSGNGSQVPDGMEGGYESQVPK